MSIRRGAGVLPSPIPGPGGGGSPKVSMVLFTVKMLCNWLTENAIDHSLIDLNGQTIQQVFNEV